MLDWETISVGRAAGETLTLSDFLRALQRQRLLKGLVLDALAEKVILGAARQAGLTVSGGELQQAADRFRQRHGLAAARQMHQWLAREGLTTEDFEAGLERDLLIGRFKQQLAQPRLADHFAAHKGRYAQAQLRQIIVGSEGVARELLAQLTDEGRDFAELAREHSLHGPSRLSGGSLGLVPRFAMPAAAAEAVFAAKPGAVVGPVATEQGFHLFLVEALPEPALDDTTAAIIRQELFDAWLRERLRDVQIDLGCLQSS